EQVEEIVIGKCSMCHAAEPLWENMRVPPGNVRLEDQSSILKNAKGIYLHAGVSRAMPPGNITGLEPAERAMLVAWYLGRETSASPKPTQ
ncbi:MAG: hypothetical protein AAF732_21495, partial [Pseudomonadota bacterium]